MCRVSPQLKGMEFQKFRNLTERGARYLNGFANLFDVFRGSVAKSLASWIPRFPGSEPTNVEAAHPAAFGKKSCWLTISRRQR